MHRRHSNESNDSCENPTTDCLSSNDPCATDQCIEFLGGSKFSCGATLETWTGIGRFTVLDLMSGTNNFMNTPNRTARLGSLLEAPPSTDDYYGIGMKGWLMPPVSGVYAFWIASDNGGELLLSSDGHPENKVRECFMPWATGVREWNKFQEHESPLIQLDAGEAYYFEVSPAIIIAALHFACSKPLHKLSFVVCTLNNALSIVCILIF
jgi:hypothetical protein